MTASPAWSVQLTASPTERRFGEAHSRSSSSRFWVACSGDADIPGSSFAHVHVPTCCGVHDIMPLSPVGVACRTAPKKERTADVFVSAGAVVAHVHSSVVSVFGRRPLRPRRCCSDVSNQRRRSFGVGQCTSLHQVGSYQCLLGEAEAWSSAPKSIVPLEPLSGPGEPGREGEGRGAGRVGQRWTLHEHLNYSERNQAHLGSVSGAAGVIRGMYETADLQAHERRQECPGMTAGHWIIPAHSPCTPCPLSASGGHRDEDDGCGGRTGVSAAAFGGRSGADWSVCCASPLGGHEHRRRRADTMEQWNARDANGSDDRRRERTWRIQVRRVS